MITEKRYIGNALSILVMLIEPTCQGSVSDSIHAFVSRRLISHTDPTTAIRRVPHPSE